MSEPTRDTQRSRLSDVPGAPPAGDARFRLLMRNAAVGMALVSADGRFLDANPAFCRMLGRERDVLIGVTVAQVMHADDVDLGLGLLRDVLADRRSSSPLRQRYLRSDGAVVWGDLSVFCLQEADGSVRELVAQIVDVSAEVEAAAAVRAGEARFRAIADSAVDAIVTADREGLISGWNAAAERMFGYAESEALGHSVMQFIPEPHVAGATAGMERLRAGSEAGVMGRTIEGVARHRDGTEVPVEISLSQWEVSGERFVTTIIRDVSERCRAQEALAASADRLRAVMDTMLDPHLLLTARRDENGRIVDFEIADANPAACALLDVGCEDLRGLRLLERFPDFGISALENQARVVETGEPLVLDDVFSSFDRPGEQRRLDVRSVPFGDGVSLTLRDATARHQAEQALRRRLSELDALQRLAQLLVQRIDLAESLDAAMQLIGTLFEARLVRVRVLPREETPSAEHVVYLRGRCAEDADAQAALADLARARRRPVPGSCADGSPLLATPLIAHDDDVGVLVVARAATAGAFGAGEQALAATAAELLAAVIRLEQLHEAETRQVASLERRRIARDLHDAVTQTIYSATLVAEGLPAVWEQEPERGRQDLELIRRLIRSAFAELRILLFELRPEALAAAALDTLLQRLCDAAAGQGEMTVALEVDPDLGLPHEVRMAFYRVAQEALNNVGKYAGAHRVAVNVSRSDGDMTLLVADDGCGFDLSAVRPESMGLTIMRERAAAIGAELAVTSAPGAGTTVRLIWPWPPAAGATP